MNHSARQKLNRIFDNRSRKTDHGHMFQEVLRELTEEEKETIVKEWVHSNLWKLHKQKQARVKRGLREPVEDFA